jgi:two-component system nitrogen regulation response regulator NtrX
VPPLRERPDDIPILVRHFSELFGREGSLRAKRFSPAALEALSQHRWKGNIRELRNTVERLLIMTRGEVIDVPDLRGILQADMRGAGPGAPGAGAGGGVAGEAPRDKPGTLREFKETAERTFLVEKLRENGWNISRTAEVIGTPRSNLYKKLEQYQISQERDG